MFVLISDAGYEQRTSNNVRTRLGALDIPQHIIILCFQTQQLPDFDTDTLPEAEILGIRSFFRDLSFEQHPRPWKGAREPTIEVSGIIQWLASDLKFRFRQRRSARSSRLQKSASFDAITPVIFCTSLGTWATCILLYIPKVVEP